MTIKVTQIFKIDGEKLYSELQHARSSGLSALGLRLGKAYNFYTGIKDRDYGELSEAQINWLENIQNEFPKRDK